MPGRKPHPHVAAERLHRAAIRLLRLLRREDDAVGLSAPRLSVLSVLVFGGHRTLAALADAEQVSRPTMTALIQAMERERLVSRSPHPEDARSVVIAATEAGRQVMRVGRDRRVERLAEWMARLESQERGLLERAGAIMEKLGEVTSRRAAPIPRPSASGPRPRRARRPR